MSAEFLINIALGALVFILVSVAISIFAVIYTLFRENL